MTFLLAFISKIRNTLYQSDAEHLLLLDLTIVQNGARQLMLVCAAITILGQKERPTSSE